MMNSFEPTRRTFLGLMGALGAIAVTGCSTNGASGSGAEAGDVNARFTWWGNKSMHEATQNVADAYTSHNPKINFTTEYMGFGDYWDKLSTQFATGTGPDVLQMSGQLLVDYSERGTLLDLEEYAGNVIDMSDWDTALANSGIVDGVRTGIPISTDSYTVMYNKATMDSIGIPMPESDWTWDDLADIAAETSAALGEGQWGVDDASWFLFYPLEVWMRSRGKTFFNREGAETHIGFDKSDLEDWYGYWQTLRNNGSAVPIELTVEGTGHESRSLVKGISPIYFTTSSEFTGVRALLPDPIEAIPFPDHADRVRPGNMIRPNLFISCSSTTEYGPQMAEFINYWVNEDEAARLLGSVRGMPVDPQAAEIAIEMDGEIDKVRSAGEYLSLIREVGSDMDGLTPRGGRDVYDLLRRTAEEIGFERVTIGEGVDQFFNEAERLLG